MRPDLFEQHTVHFHGYPNASSYYDGVPDATWAINIGGSATYYYLAPDAETYFYHCHITPPEHLQMGIVGQLYVRPRQNRVPIGGDLYKSLVGCVGNPIGCSGPGSTNPGQQSDLRTACNTSSVTDQDILCSTPVPQSDSGFMQVVDPFAGTDPAYQLALESSTHITTATARTKMERSPITGSSSTRALTRRCQPTEARLLSTVFPVPGIAKARQSTPAARRL